MKNGDIITKDWSPKNSYQLLIIDFKSKNTSRRTYLTQMITNHGRFNDYLTIFKLMDDKNYDQCQEVEDYTTIRVRWCRVIWMPQFDRLQFDRRHVIALQFDRQQEKLIKNRWH